MEMDALWRRVVDIEDGNMWGIGALMLCKGHMEYVFGRISERG